MYRHQRLQIYSIYVGGQPRGSGTIAELAEKTGLKEDTLRYYETKAHKDRVAMRGETSRTIILEKVEGEFSNPKLITSKGDKDMDALDRITKTELLSLFDQAAQNYDLAVVVEVTVPGSSTPEIIVTLPENIRYKQKYYARTYDANLVHIKNSDIRIVQVYTDKADRFIHHSKGE